MSLDNPKFEVDFLDKEREIYAKITENIYNEEWIDGLLINLNIAPFLNL